MSKLITLSAPVVAKNPITKEAIKRVVVDDEGKVTSQVDDEPWNEYRILTQLVFVRPEWEKPLSRQRMQNRILDKLDFKEAGQEIVFTDDEWRSMRDSLEADDFTLPKHWGSQLVPLCDNIINAVTAAEPE